MSFNISRLPAILRTNMCLGLAAACSLAGCTVGPDYKGPPNAASIASRATFFHRVGYASVTAVAPPARWWDALNDPLLTRLIDTALRNSPTIEQAEARVRNARATVNEQQAGLLPKASATGVAGEIGIPTGTTSSLLGTSTSGGQTATGTTSFPHHTSLYDAGFDASWEIDLFGGTRRKIEGARAQAEVRQAQLADAQVQLAAEVAQDYISLRDVQHRLILLQRSAEMEHRMLDLTRQRRTLGTASDIDVERLTTQFEQTQASVVPLKTQADQYSDEIATLAGKEPGQLDQILASLGMIPLPPPVVPIGDPASMLRRRPDIREAERQLAASNAQIGEAIAGYFPTVDLRGSLGFSSTDSSKLFSHDNFTWYGIPMLSWNVLDFGRTSAQVQEAKAGNDEALARYRSTVLSALQDAETALSRFGHEREHVETLTAADASAARASALTQQRLHVGTASMIDLLDVERQHLDTEQSLAQAQCALTNDYVSLQKALGLGWSAPQQPADAR